MKWAPLNSNFAQTVPVPFSWFVIPMVERSWIGTLHDNNFAEELIKTHDNNFAPKLIKTRDFNNFAKELIKTYDNNFAKELI